MKLIYYRIYTSSSDAHSRASSLAEDNESYVPMHPSSTAETLMQMAQSDDYMNMQPASTSVSQTSTRGGDISSATSSCSITSGTPSTDIRFSEYHLDKVQARFTPCDDDDQLDRPPRTYSVGSKLEHSKRKHHIERVALEHSSRLRAYSVGSRNIKVTRAELTSHSGSHTPSHNSPTAVNHHEINNNSTSKNKKSSSVPMLSNHSGRAVHGSIDHMDDLMEIDYSKSSDNSNSPNLTNGTPVKSSPMNIPSKNAEDYMNMSGRGSKPHTPSNASPYVDMRPGNRRISENIDNEYMDMAAPARNNSSSLSSSPLKATSAPQTVPQKSKNSNYMDMSPRSYDGGSSSRKNRMTSSTGSFSSAKAPSDDYLNMSPVNKNLLDVGLPSRSSVPDGYMEMSWNTKNKKSDSKANDNPSSSSDEYINMDFSNNNDGAGTSDSSSSAKERSPSMPITIQKRHSSSSRSQKSLKSGSIEGEPPTFLPLVNPMTASISPTRSTNRIRCDSRDSGIVTPSSGSQATIFPFSPTSPNNFEERKVLVDGTNGSIKISESDTIEEEPRTPVPAGMLGANENNVEILSSDYAVMNIGEPVSKKPNLAATPVQIKSSPSSANSSHFSMNQDSGNTNYMNCLPNASTTKIVTPKAMTAVQQAAQNSSQEVGDYALMNPLKTVKSPIQAQPPSSSDEYPPMYAPKKSLFLTLSSQEKLNSNSCFKPIVEDDSTNRSHPALHRQISEKSQHLNDSAYEVLARPSLSRPNSVNSEKVKQCYFSNRPSSALSSTSTSTSTLCETQSQNSSSQTLRSIETSAVPSPMSVTSRPESVSSDIHMASRPPSVTSERELHYASLDLPQCSSTNAYFAQPQRMEVDQKMDFSTSPSPQQTSSSSSSASSQQSQPAFTYAQIDFNAKSENTKAQQQHQNQSGTKK